MSYTNPCNLSLNPKNTGVDCDSALRATAMLVFMPKATRWTQADVDASPYNGSFTAFMLAKFHAAPAQRWYPFFGNAAPINNITESDEADVTETLDDGSVVFIRYGKANRTFSTVNGGYCLAKTLMQFPQGYSFIEFDIDGKKAEYEPTPGVYAGFPVIMMKGLSPDLANLKTSFKNKLMLTFDKVAYFVSGKLTAPSADEDVLGLNGLLDAEVSEGTVGSASTTHVFVKVTSECSETDLVAAFTGTGAGTIGQIANFVVKNASGGVITPSAVAVAGSEVDLTGTYPTGTTITVELAAPSVLKANGIEGYEGTVIASIAIP